MSPESNLGEVARILVLNESHIRLIVESIQLTSFSKLFRQARGARHGKI